MKPIEAIDILKPRVQNKLISAANSNKKREDVPEAQTEAGCVFYEYLIEELKTHPGAIIPPVELDQDEIDSMRAAAFGNFEDDDDDDEEA